MAEGFDFKRLRRQVLIYRIVQICLLTLLIFMAFKFQSTFLAKGESHVFRNSMLATLIIQLAAFYPLNRFGIREATLEISACSVNISVEELKGLRKKRLYGDFLKMSVFIFFIVFIARAPAAGFVLSTTFFTFIMTTLTYFQCFNFAAKRGMG